MMNLLRICVPTSDAIDGQFDNSVKELSGIGGESAQKHISYC